MGTPKVMRLIDGHTGRMQCKVCGAEHYASIKPMSGGQYYRGSWQCIHGCKLSDMETPEWQGTQLAKIREDVKLYAEFCKGRDWGIPAHNKISR